MSAQAITHVWNAKGVTPEEKLLLIWIANASGGLGYPVMVEWDGMGEFIGGDIYRALEVVRSLEQKGLLRWGTEEEETSSYLWVVYDGEYYPPPDFTQEPKRRHGRVAALIERDGPYCAYCERIPVDYHIDHFIPRCLGGADKMSNLVLACAPCNMAKGARRPEEFLADRPKLLRSIRATLEACEE